MLIFDQKTNNINSNNSQIYSKKTSPVKFASFSPQQPHVNATSTLNYNMADQQGMTDYSTLSVRNKKRNIDRDFGQYENQKVSQSAFIGNGTE